MIDRGIARHIASVEAALFGSANARSIHLAAEQIRTTRSAGGTVWCVGNGGSLAIAQHFAQDLLKACAVRAQALNDGSVITAYANDVAFSGCHEEPLKVLWRPGKDVLVIFSCSGSSRNVATLGEHFGPVIAIVGTNGGVLKKEIDVCVHANSKEYDVCETAFQVVADVIIKTIKRKSVR